MAFKNSLAASGYICAIIGGGYAVHYYLQDHTIGDLLKRLGKVHTTEEDFKKTYILFKDNEEFKTDIQESNTISLTSNDQGGWKTLKKWCNSKSALPLTKENREKYLQKAQKYCIDFFESALVSLVHKTGLGWREVKKNIAEKGISKNGQLFVAFEDTKSIEKEKKPTVYYCWDTETKDWKKSEGAHDCRNWEI